MAANYVLLERIELNASAASVTFANIPQSGYTDLKIVMSARTERPSTGSDVYLQFNGITTATYSFRRLYGYGSGAASGALTNDSQGGFAGNADAANNTSSTFGNAEIYIPNYTGSTAKSWSVDSVLENNATDAIAEIIAGYWSGTSPITSIKLQDYTGYNFVQYSTFSLYGLAAVGTTPAIAPKASGGNITTDGTYWIHTFLTTDTFTPAVALTCDYLVVAGGGGSGGEAGAGGGAGGYRTSVGTQGGGVSAGSPLSVLATSYTVTVGAGGAGGSSSGGSGGGIGGNGSNSIFSTITSLGGGGGNGYSAGSLDGAAGGSGGGGGSGGNLAVGLGGAASSPTQGYAGGTGTYVSPNKRAQGGGGGAGAVGANGVSVTGAGGNGGVGVATSISGTSTYYAGGGGGSGETTQGTGGNGGGGTNSAGTANTGGGGSLNYSFAGGKAGGSGIVIIRYPIA